MVVRANTKSTAFSLNKHFRFNFLYMPQDCVECSS